MGDYDLGLVGLAVMGQNLVLNMERNGYRIAVFNRSAGKTREYLAGPASGKNILGTFDYAELVASLKKPRAVMLMVKAGNPVDQVIADLTPYLEPGDLIIDGGNSYFHDTERRSKELEKNGLHFLGVGISGGEEGALHGPSIMPGGQPEAYRRVESIFTAIAARAKGEPCVVYIGPRGSGHYVKMVHNGIEYGDMQLIAEAYDLLSRGLGLQANELYRVFERWNQGVLSSYLVEITADIFRKQEEGSGTPLVELILDQAQQKGTGRWTAQEALELGYPVPTLNAAVEARNLSGLKSERVLASAALSGPDGKGFQADRETFIEYIGEALYASKICSYAQGMGLLSVASAQYDYRLDYGAIAKIWRAGCIIRAAFLDDVYEAYAQNPDLTNLLMAPFFRQAVESRQKAWRQVIRMAIELGIPTPAMSASLAYYDGYRSARLPANLIQAQRDYFGAHTYQRIDREGTFHTEWAAD
jgi:6-phosphogluconate dehydrogenase